MALADQRCVPCRGGVPPLGAERIAEGCPLREDNII